MHAAVQPPVFPSQLADARRLDGLGYRCHGYGGVVCIESQHDVGMGTWLHPIGVNRVLAIHNRASVVLRWLQQSFWSPTILSLDFVMSRSSDLPRWSSSRRLRLAVRVTGRLPGRARRAGHSPVMLA